MLRRSFFYRAAAAAGMAILGASPRGPRRVAVIGHTGRGNYGHGLDVVWQKIPGIEIVGVADGDPRGLQQAMERLKTEHGFPDYRQMLEQQQPEFVSVAPRQPDQHFDMAMAAIKTGVKGLYVEKPFCRSPREADLLMQAAEDSGAKIAVAHRNRYHPVLPIVRQLVQDGQIGRLLKIEGHGLGDRRGGGEDLWVLGGHVFNLFQYFGGKPQWCSANILQDGRLATKSDMVDGAEALGRIVGNEIQAQWLLADGITATYTTYTEDGSNKEGYAATLIGTKGTISLHIDRDPIAWFSPGNPFAPVSHSQDRVPITSAGLGKPETQPDLIASVHNHVLAVQDLIECVDTGRTPLCDASQAALAVEMTCSVFVSHFQHGARVTFPLSERGQPFEEKQDEPFPAPQP